MTTYRATQPRVWSFIESIANVLVGAGVALVSQIVVFPLVGIHGVSFGTNLEIAAYFTAISVARSYVIRRYFNGLKFRQ